MGKLVDGEQRVISTRHKFIFLHVPKTAGNSIQTWLLPYSDDQKVVSGHQDGIETFNIRGAITPTKHAGLQKYADVLGPRLADFATVIPVRDPLDRILSLYFSPHRMVGRAPGSKLTYETRFFDALARQTPPMTEYLSVDGAIRAPSLIVRYENLAADLATMATRFDLPKPELPQLNQSADRDGERERLKRHPEVLAIVRDRFAEDYRYFGYEIPTTA